MSRKEVCVGKKVIRNWTGTRHEAKSRRHPPQLPQVMRVAKVKHPSLQRGAKINPLEKQPSSF